MKDKDAEELIEELDGIARDYDSYEFGLPSNDDSRERMREAIFKKFAGDSGSVDEDFLSAIGGIQEDNPIKFTFHRPDALPIGLWKVSDGWKAVVVYAEFGAMDLVRQVNTRGEFRRLAASLKILLKELP